jgi:hypothetical protein
MVTLVEKNSTIKWMNNAIPHLPDFLKRNSDVQASLLKPQLNEINRKMYRFTGHKATGKWYIAYGPAWTDLGGLWENGNAHRLIP